MPKNIVFCADGTWDDPNNNSNVCQLFEALVNNQNRQLAFYDTGVGADCKPIWKILGGSIGTGLFKKIKDGYSTIASNYSPDDRIFLFGFSRGAYTVRSLAGMIAICGLPTINKSDPNLIDIAFEAYRNKTHREMLLDDLKSTYLTHVAKIHFLGVWDTVGSLGIPAFFGGIDVKQYGFLDTNLHPNVLNAVQALSIDEARCQFQPTLWTSKPFVSQTIDQVWFTGVHCDVGGGYCLDSNGSALSKITLHWMTAKAMGQGILLKQKFSSIPQSPPYSSSDAFATIHNSRTGLYRVFPKHVRNVSSDSYISDSVDKRCNNSMMKYHPQNLSFNNGILAQTYTIV